MGTDDLKSGSCITLPEDPVMLRSVVNTLLRDNNLDCDEFCKANGIDRAGLDERLKGAGFEYAEELRQYR